MLQARAMFTPCQNDESTRRATCPSGALTESALTSGWASRWLLGVSSLLLAAQISGCSSDHSGPSAQDQCEMLAEQTCDRLVNCASELTGEKPGSTDHKDCVDSITSESDCSKAVSVSKGYAECIDDIRSATCDDVYSVAADGSLEVNELPPVCKGVILTK
jgi:hypothetical protein